MFLREQQGLELAGGTTARSLDRAVVAPSALESLRARAVQLDWVPDLGTRIGSATWWRGLATCAALCCATLALSPGLHRPIVGAVNPPLSGAAWDEARAQSIAPLAFGADTGRRMAAGDLVVPLAETPERPVIELTATLGDGDTFDRVLERAGVGRGDADRAAGMIADAVPLGDIPTGTQIALTLGRRPNRMVPRPLEKLSLRARFDLAVTLMRAGDALEMQRRTIAIDRTPLRIEGLVGSSLYRSARAAGVPASIVDSYIKALATRLSIGRDVGAADSFDIIIDRARAATGETRLGQLLFAGLDQGRRKTELVRWTDDGHDQWVDASGRLKRSGAVGLPAAGHITSTFGMRMHPLLHMMRMHKGIDIGAPTGTPIHAALAGVVQVAGRAGGYGNFVKLAHSKGIATGYGHMSRIAVHRGEHVAAGEVIGYVGSTGLSTGPHLHWEVWKNGVSINPRAISVAGVFQLSGAALRAFRARVAELLAVKPAA